MRLEELTENKLEQARYNAQFDKQMSTKPAIFNVMVNGKIWKRNGIPVPFKDYAAARSAADKITANRNITTQVVPAR